MKIFELDNDGERDWIIALNAESAIEHCKEFHDGNGDDLSPITLIREVPKSEWATNMIRMEDEKDESDNDLIVSFKDQIDSMKLDPLFKLPYYLCGTMF